MVQGDNILLQIRGKLPYLKPALKRIGEYVIANMDKVKTQKIAELAGFCQVSEATVTRFVREIGINSFQGLKIAIAERTMAGRYDTRQVRKEVYCDVSQTDSIDTIVDKILIQSIETLKNTRGLISHTEIEKAIAAIEKAAMLAIYCSGASTAAGQSAKSRFYRVGKRCFLATDAVDQSISASLLDKKCVAMGITSSGRTKSVVNAMKIAQKAGATTLCITDSDRSPIVAYSDITFFTSSIFSSFLQDAMSSKMPELFIIDILYACFAARNFKLSIKYIEKSAAAIKDTIFYKSGSGP
jgi:RpiR family transcriptional regulator, carbohydrate utilization regulator